MLRRNTQMTFAFDGVLVPLLLLPVGQLLGPMVCAAAAAAIISFDEFDNSPGSVGRSPQHQLAKDYYALIEAADSSPFDDTSGSGAVEWGNLDPRQQRIGSSYSVVETSGTSTGPQRFAYSRREYDPAVDNWSEEREQQPRKQQQRQRDSKRSKAKMKVRHGADDDRGHHRDRLHHQQQQQQRKGASIKDKDVELIRRKPNKRKYGDSESGYDERRNGRPRQTRRKKVKLAEASRKPAVAFLSADDDSREKYEELSPSSTPLLGAGSSGSAAAKKGQLQKKSEAYHLRPDDDGGGEAASYEEGYDAEKHYGKEGGKKYAVAHKSEDGDKAHKAHKKVEAFDVAEEEKRDKEEKRAEFGEKHGLKKGHMEQEKQFGEGYEGKAGEKGISVTKKGGHKKGHKKSGFHKVHHKDEYKKDEVFYDEGHNGDEHEEHAHEQEKHSKEKEAAAKKAVVDSKYHEGHGEKKGLLDKGHNFEQASGHKKEKGEEAHHDSHSEFDKKGGVQEGEKHGHEEGGSSKGGHSEYDYF